jgi:hypothetical protein
MADLGNLLVEMHKIISKNFPLYMKEHAGDWIFLKYDSKQIHVSFLKTHEEVMNAMKKMQKYPGETDLPIYFYPLPIKSHKNNPRNKKSGGILDDFIEFCPNDGKTRLLSRGLWSLTSNEDAYCPDCSYEVSRKPSLERRQLLQRIMDYSGGLFPD